MDTILEKIKAIAAAVAEDQKVELVHCEMAGTRRDSIVRIYIDKEGGVTLDDCSQFSSAVETVLDADENLIPGTYVLEISSPGIERELYSLGDFEKFAGRLAKVKFREPVDGQKSFTGDIVSVSEGVIVMSSGEGTELRFGFDQVSKANLKMDLGKELSGRRKA